MVCLNVPRMIIDALHLQTKDTGAVRKQKASNLRASNMKKHTSTPLQKSCIKTPDKQNNMKVVLMSLLTENVKTKLHDCKKKQKTRLRVKSYAMICVLCS